MGPLQIEQAESDAVEPEVLVVTHWFDSGQHGDAYAATIRLTGRRIGVVGKGQRSDAFSKEEIVAAVLPGSGPVSISTSIVGLTPGDWTVTGEVIRPASHAATHRLYERRQRVSAEPLRVAAWSWRRWSLSTGPSIPVKTRWAAFAPLARLPAVLPGSWIALATLGIVVALITQAVILAGKDVPVGPSLSVSLLVIVLSLLAAKLWYAALHPGPWRTWIGGWSVDGFVFVGPPVAVAALLLSNLPVGVVLDAAAPGLFFGVTIGRLGCFFTGCCAGRCTRSRWGVWSSDRRIGARRVPTQLLESATGLAIGLAATVAVEGGLPVVPGTVFVFSFGTYVVARQILLRLRAERRTASWRRTASVAGKPS